MPEEWLIGRLCEEFPALKPSEAANEPLYLCLRIIEYRAYARAKAIVENTKNMDDLPNDPMVKLVEEIQIDIVREKRVSRKIKR